MFLDLTFIFYTGIEKNKKEKIERKDSK